MCGTSQKHATLARVKQGADDEVAIVGVRLLLTTTGLEPAPSNGDLVAPMMQYHTRDHLVQNEVPVDLPQSSKSCAVLQTAETV